MKSAPQPQESRLLGLELLRFLSAVAVLVWHYQHFWFVGPQLQYFVRSEQPLYTPFKLFYEWGWYGVQVFWFISGYVFFWKYLGPIRERTVGKWQFFVLRFSRLYPLHLLTLVLVGLLQYAYHASTGLLHVYQDNDAYHAVLQLFMASNWGLQDGDSFNGPIWSVSLEILAYLFFFAFALVVGRRPWLIVLTVLVSGAAYQLKFGQLFQCIFCFFIGGLAAVAGSSPVAKRHEKKVVVASIAYIVGLALIFRAFHLFDKKALVHLYLATAVPLLILALATRPWLSRMPARMATTLGNTTYSSYLLHFPLQVGLMLWAANTGWRIPREQPWFFLAYLGASLAVGVLAYRYFEMPMQKQLRAWMLRHSAGHRSASATAALAATAADSKLAR